MSNPKKRKQGSVLKQKRMEAGLTQEKAIEYLGFSLRSLQAYEKGESTPCESGEDGSALWMQGG